MKKIPVFQRDPFAKAKSLPPVQQKTAPGVHFAPVPAIKTSQPPPLKAAGKAPPVQAKRGPGVRFAPVPSMKAPAPPLSKFVPAIAQTKTQNRAANGPRPPVLQRRVDYKQGQNRDLLLAAMERIDRAQEKPLGREKLEQCFRVLEVGNEYHGRIDAENEQMAGLIYFQCVRVSKREGNVWEDLGQRLEDVGHGVADLRRGIGLLQNTYELAIVGKGSAAAYYIDTLGVAYDHQYTLYTLLIGEDDPWAGRRGFGISYINHVESQISYPSEGAKGYSTQFVQRAAFAQRTKQIIENAIPAANRFEGRADNISREERDGRTVYRIVWTGGGRQRTHYAYKVIVAAGAGPHSDPRNDLTQLNDDRAKKRVMDMDTFIREYVSDLTGNERIIVQGPNAAVDAAAAANLRRCSVTWVVRSTPPVYLPGTLYDLGRIPLYKAGDKNAFRIAIQTGADQEKRLTVNLTSVRRCTAFNHQHLRQDELEAENVWGNPENLSLNNVDYFVYGVGQDAKFQGDQGTPAAPGHFLSKELRENLGLAYHTDGRYDVVNAPLGKQAVGLKAAPLNKNVRDEGLYVIGGSAATLSKEDVKKQLADVNKFQSADIVAYEQLGGIRSAMYGMNNILPPDIGQRVDFSHATPRRSARTSPSSTRTSGRTMRRGLSTRSWPTAERDTIPTVTTSGGSATGKGG
jgi:hypothetical protein